MRSPWVPSTPAGGSASSQFVQCTALPATAVAFNPDVIGASLEAFDGAGNPSMQVPVHWLDVVASPRHTRINASPHHLRPLGALPDGPLAAPSLDAGLEPAWSLDRTPLVIGGESLLTTDFPSIYAADLSRLGDQENLTVDPFAGRQPPTAHDAWADENFTGWLSKRTPAGRWGNVEELAGAAIFLASKASSFVNGHILYVDGGITAGL